MIDNVTQFNVLFGGGIEMFLRELAEESGFTNSFQVNNGGSDAVISGGSSMSEPINGQEFTVKISNGLLDLGGGSEMLFTTNGTNGLNAPLGSPGFGIFYNKTNLTSNLLVFAFDDQDPTKGPDDDNHDDYIVGARISAVPLPAGVLLLGLALGGLAAYRRRAVA
jgi:hypothetical protein